MQLEIDAGNSRIKWRLRRGDTLITRGVESGSPVAALEVVVQAASAGALQGEIDRVAVVSVRDDAARETLAAQIEQRLQVVPCFAEVSTNCAGIANSYTEPQRMGVDRWSAMVAAAQKLDIAARPRPFCVVDAGSAMTLDFVAADGRHRGGYIVPGLSLQIDSLLRATGQIAMDEAAVPQQLLPADNTTDAVRRGVILSMLQLLQHSVADFASAAGSSVEVFATGGDIETLLKCSDLSVRHCPDLVLDGVQYLLP